MSGLSRRLATCGSSLSLSRSPVGLDSVAATLNEIKQVRDDLFLLYQLANGSMLKAANISSIPQRSPFRYPGGKTWLIPQIRSWLRVHGGQEVRLIEPFTGGGIVTLTAVMEGLVRTATMVELDSDVAAVWRAILGRGGPALAKQVRTFDFTEQNVLAILDREPRNLREHAFQTILKNRVKRNGILASGAGMLKKGEAGYGLKSRWYPNTLAERILEIVKHKEKITFKHGDGLRHLKNCREKRNFIYFIDPPYNEVGRRLYRHGEINHDELFETARNLEGPFLMTYNKTQEVLELTDKYGFETEQIQMNVGSANAKVELLIARDLSWISLCSCQRPNVRPFEVLETYLMD